MTGPRVVGHVAAAQGAPCPTLVLDARDLPEGADLDAALTDVRAALKTAGLGHVLKIALISPSAHPLFDLTYRFVQCIPDRFGERFDHLGSCGHSIVASTLVASRLAWVPRLAPGHRIRVHVVNTDDHVVCEVEEARREGGDMTVYFLQQPRKALPELLVTGAARDTLAVGGQDFAVSLVSMGNPYVFVRAADVGVHSRAELFADDPALFDTLVALRRAAAARWGWPLASAFPKIAVIGAFSTGQLCVRAVSVPSWHPTLALTGAICLAAAAAIDGTVVHDAVHRASGRATPAADDGLLRIETPAGTLQALATVHRATDPPQLSWVSVGGKRAHYVGVVAVELTAPTCDLSTTTEEFPAWRPVLTA